MGKKITINETQLESLVTEVIAEIAGIGCDAKHELDIAISELGNYISEDPTRQYDLAIVMNKLNNVKRCLESQEGF